MRAGAPSGRRKPDLRVSADIDWENYARVHSDRRNLLIHAIAVPLFVAATLGFAWSLVVGDVLLLLAAALGAVAAMVLQAKGHALEKHPPEPFTGPGNFLKRWFREQFLIFPLYLATGRWWRRFSMSSG